jgi:putative spermidine/putrescine transport system permease protein
LVGTAQGSGLLGVVWRGGLLAGLAFVAGTGLGRTKSRALGADRADGRGAFPLGGCPGWSVGALSAGSSAGSSTGSARALPRELVPYLTAGQVLWHYTFRVICGAIFFFLITPILVVMPLSFNAEDFFTFTPEMLRLRPRGLFAQALPRFLHQSRLAAGAAQLGADRAGGDAAVGDASARWPPSA